MNTRKRKDGGEGGIRTLDTLLTYTPLAGERLQPLGHFSVFCCQTRYFRSSSLALPRSALLGALRIALRAAVVPPALLRSLRPLGQPLGHFSGRRADYHSRRLHKTATERLLPITLDRLLIFSIRQLLSMHRDIFWRDNTNAHLITLHREYGERDVIANL